MSFNPTKTHKDNLYVNHNTISILSEEKHTFMWLETRVHRVKEVEMSRVEAGVDCRCLSEVNIRSKHKRCMSGPTRQMTSDWEIKSQIHKRAGMQHISTHVCSHEWKVNHIKNCVYTTRLFRWQWEEQQRSLHSLNVKFRALLLELLVVSVITYRNKVNRRVDNTEAGQPYLCTNK